MLAIGFYYFYFFTNLAGYEEVTSRKNMALTV